MKRLLGVCIPLLLISTPVLADPIYQFTDLGAVSSGRVVQYGTDSNGQGYVTNTDGQFVSPFVRSTITSSTGTALDPALVQRFPAGTVFRPDLQSPQGAVVGLATVPGGPGLNGNEQFYWQPNGDLVTLAVGSGPPVSTNDINSSGTTVGERLTYFFDGRPYGETLSTRGVLTIFSGPILFSPFKSPFDPTRFIDLAQVVRQPGWDLSLPFGASSTLEVSGKSRIDDQGRIVAYGKKDGSVHAFLLTPPSLSTSPQPVPEPASLVVFGVATILLLARSVRLRRFSFAREIVYDSLNAFSGRLNAQSLPKRWFLEARS